MKVIKNIYYRDSLSKINADFTTSGNMNLTEILIRVVKFIGTMQKMKLNHFLVIIKELCSLKSYMNVLQNNGAQLPISAFIIYICIFIVIHLQLYSCIPVKGK